MELKDFVAKVYEDTKTGDTQKVVIDTTVTSKDGKILVKEDWANVVIEIFS